MIYRRGKAPQFRGSATSSSSSSGVVGGNDGRMAPSASTSGRGHGPPGMRIRDSTLGTNEEEKMPLATTQPPPRPTTELIDKVKAKVAASQLSTQQNQQQTLPPPATTTKQESIKNDLKAKIQVMAAVKNAHPPPSKQQPTSSSSSSSSSDDDSSSSSSAQPSLPTPFISPPFPIAKQSSSSSSSDEEEDDSESSDSLPRPIFVSKAERQEARILQEEKAAKEAIEHQDRIKRQKLESTRQLRVAINEEVTAEAATIAANEDAMHVLLPGIPSDADGIDEIAEYEAWKQREFARLEKETFGDTLENGITNNSALVGSRPANSKRSVFFMDDARVRNAVMERIEREEGEVVLGGHQ